MQNLWGIPYITPCLDSRLEMVGKIIENSCYDIIILEEVWCNSSKEYLKEKGRKTYQSIDFNYGAGIPFIPDFSGSGFLILTKIKVAFNFYHNYKISGYPHALTEMDYYASKGCGLLRLEHNQESIDLYVTHIHASYSEDHTDKMAIRMNQVYKIVIQDS